VAQCMPATPATVRAPWDRRNFPGIPDEAALQQVLTDKVFKIILTSKPRGSFPSAIWRSSHVIFFEEL